MTSLFKQKIRTSLANPSLQAALDDNAVRRRVARLAAYETLPEDPPVLRRRAHIARREVVADLDIYLEQFTANAQANGFTIHHAASAQEAVRQVLAIVAESGGKHIVKSKTMVGEELEINSALENAGYEVVETDLGEWIVQLRGEKPAHLLTPAVHLNRKDVARLFEDKFGLPYTEDVPELTAFARRTLRSAFLKADVGISGVNFGVVSEGAICLVTNEGNGRMATTLPPVHIALMGCERLVRNLDELSLMLSLLPRASSGQKMSVYTTLIKKPRQGGEVDGALQRHIILIDNGRMALRGSPLEESLFCIRCGSCLNACPVFREIGGHAYVGTTGKATPYSGPIGSVISAGLFSAAEYSNLARASSLCGACQEACPVDIPLPELLLRVRAGMSVPAVSPAGTEIQPQDVPISLGWGLRLFSWLAANPTRFRAAQNAGGKLARLFMPRSTWISLPVITGWGASRDLPLPASKSFQTRWQEQAQTQAVEKFIQEEAATRQNNPIPTGDEKSLLAHSKENTLFEHGLADKFRFELEAVGGRFETCQPEELHGKLVSLLEETGVDRVLAWSEKELPVGTIEALVKNHIQVCYTPDASIQVGLTGALAAVAETGTLVLSGGKGRPLTASLLPEIHMAILSTSRITQNLSQMFAQEAVKNFSYLTLITGPSRTADIEMTLTIGVHGPRELIVLCVQDGDTRLV